MHISIKSLKEGLNVNDSKFFLVSIFIFAPLVDNLTGFLLSINVIARNTAGSPSQFFRFIVLFYSIYLLRRNGKELFIISLVFLYLMFLEFIYAYTYQNLSFLASGIVYSTKVVYVVSVLFLLKRFLIEGRFSLAFIGNLLFYSILLHATLIILPKTLGIGVSTYGYDTFGSKGFFPSNNGLGFFCGIGGIFITYWLKLQQKKYRVLFFIWIAIGTILVGSKTALILVFINSIYFFITIRSSLKWIVLFGLVVFILVNVKQLTNIFLMVFDVVAYRYENNTEFSKFFFSSRDTFAINAFGHCSFDGVLGIRVFFGAGSFLSYRNPGDILDAFAMLESDVLDVFFYYGIVGLVIYFTFFFRMIIVGIRNRIDKILILVWVLVFGHSILAGHILFNGMSLLTIFAIWYIINWSIVSRRIKSFEVDVKKRR